MIGIPQDWFKQCLAYVDSKSKLDTDIYWYMQNVAWLRKFAVQNMCDELPLLDTFKDTVFSS